MERRTKTLPRRKLGLGAHRASPGNAVDLGRPSRVVNLQAKPQFRLHRLGSRQFGKITDALRQLPFARHNDPVDFEQSKVWPQIRAGHQHVHVPEIRASSGPGSSGGRRRKFGYHCDCQRQLQWIRLHRRGDGDYASEIGSTAIRTESCEVRDLLRSTTSLFSP